MKLTTIVISPEGKPTNLRLEVVNQGLAAAGNLCTHFVLYDSAQNKRLGILMLADEHFVKINGIANETRGDNETSDDTAGAYRHVGSALVECWLRFSDNLSYRLEAAGDSCLFHAQMGFRFEVTISVPAMTDGFIFRKFLDTHYKKQAREFGDLFQSKKHPFSKQDWEALEKHPFSKYYKNFFQTLYNKSPEQISKMTLEEMMQEEPLREDRSKQLERINQLNKGLLPQEKFTITQSGGMELSGKFLKDIREKFNITLPLTETLPEREKIKGLKPGESCKFTIEQAKSLADKTSKENSDVQVNTKTRTEITAKPMTATATATTKQEADLAKSHSGSFSPQFSAIVKGAVNQTAVAIQPDLKQPASMKIQK